jgi:hypothetical protein
MHRLRRKGAAWSIISVFALATFTGIEMMPSQAEASEFRGRLGSLRFGPGPGLVAVSVGPHNSPCSSLAWFAFENAPIWAQTLAWAKSSNRTVRIVGTGTCDQLGRERIASFDVD